MVFSSIIFIFGFLPFSLLVYYLSPKKIRNFVILIFSLLFYFWGEPKYIFIMLFSTVFDFINGILIEKFRYNKKFTKIILINSILINLGILCYFKYSNFIIDNINNILNLNINLLNIVLPIGISFYTFQTLSYTIDVYKGTIKAQHNIINFGTYVTMFPQLIAGPIVQYKDVEKQLNDRKETLLKFNEGINRFCFGLFKKVVIANNIGLVFEQISNISNLTVILSWLGAIAFSFQIYFDFSGYSDMAIGLGKMFGFDFKENFNLPYCSKSITEFWRRWHISLGNWFKEYVYIPLGGSRKGKIRLTINLLIVWFLTGLWHGASWNFVIWGLYFGILLILEKTVLNKILKKINSFVRHLITLFFIVISWIIFAFDNISEGLTYIKSMFCLNNNSFISNETIYYFKENILLLFICLFFSFGLYRNIKKYIFKSVKNVEIKSLIELFIYFILFILSIVFLVSDTYNPFLYFRF